MLPGPASRFDQPDSLFSPQENKIRIKYVFNLLNMCLKRNDFLFFYPGVHNQSKNEIILI